MSWLRHDDSECLDPRIGELDNNLYRARHALMQYVAREHPDTGLFREDHIRHAIYATPKGPRALTRRGLQRLQDLDIIRSRDQYQPHEITALGIRDWPDGWLRIHHWERYNPPRGDSLDERVAAILTADPTTTANEVVRIIGGQRTAVLASVRRFQTGSRTGSPNGTSTSGEPVRALAGACVPVPSRTPSTPEETAASEALALMGLDAADEVSMQKALTEIGWTAAQRQSARQSPSLAFLWVAMAIKHGAENPGGYAWAGFKTGRCPVDGGGKALVDHLRDERPFACPECGIGFKSEQRVREHLRVVHEIGEEEPA